MEPWGLAIHTPIQWFRVSFIWADYKVQLWSRPHEAVDSSCQQGTVLVVGSSIMVSVLFMWHGLDLLAHLNLSLISGCCIILLYDQFMYNDGSFQHYKVSSSNKYCVTILALIKHIWDVVEMRIHMQDPASTNIRKLWINTKMVWFSNLYHHFMGDCFVIRILHWRLWNQLWPNL